MGRSGANLLRLCSRVMVGFSHRSVLGVKQNLCYTACGGRNYMDVQRMARRRGSSRRRTRAQVISTGQGTDPRVGVAKWLRERLEAPVRSEVTVMDASGKPMATVDPYTRRRTPVAPSAD